MSAQHPRQHTQTQTTLEGEILAYISKHMYLNCKYILYPICF